MFTVFVKTAVCIGKTGCVHCLCKDYCMYRAHGWIQEFWKGGSDLLRGFVAIHLPNFS